MGSIGSVNRYGQDLNGRFVTNAAQYQAAVALIRTPQGQTQTHCTPVSSVALHRCFLARLHNALHPTDLASRCTV